MNPFKLFYSITILLTLLLLTSCTQQAIKPIPLHSATIPVHHATSINPGHAGWHKGSSWMGQHRDINAIGRNNQVDLVFLGDSITQSFGGPGRNVWKADKDAWEKYYGKRRAFNFGISGDRTQHILWRIHQQDRTGVAI